MQKQTISTGYQNIRQPFGNPIPELLKYGYSFSLTPVDVGRNTSPCLSVAQSERFYQTVHTADALKKCPSEVFGR